MADAAAISGEDKEEDGGKKTASGSAGPAETLGFYERSEQRPEEKTHHLSDLSLFRFIGAELTRGYFLEHNEAKYRERRERVYTCLRIPRELEKLMIFGFFLCLDAFLYVFTLLPLRVLLAFIRFLTLPCCGLSGGRVLQPAQVCDILKGVILVICYFMMHYVDYSMMYHLIRGQSVIKLYIIYNMLEVADRLFSSFGQDILDALYWTATEHKERKRAHLGVIPHFFMAVLYVCILCIWFLCVIRYPSVLPRLSSRGQNWGSFCLAFSVDLGSLTVYSLNLSIGLCCHKGCSFVLRLAGIYVFVVSVRLPKSAVYK